MCRQHPASSPSTSIWRRVWRSQQRSRERHASTLAASELGQGQGVSEDITSFEIYNEPFGDENGKLGYILGIAFGRVSLLLLRRIFGKGEMP